MDNNIDFLDETANISDEHLAICPLDGRYKNIGKRLAPYFSEYALVKNRVKVEIFWLRFLIENIKDSEILSNFDRNNLPKIMSIYEDFCDKSFNWVKKIESVTNHDVKAVELFIGEKLAEMGLNDLISFVHFGCTSEDINNPSYAKMIASAIKEVWMPSAEKLINYLSELSKKYANLPMLAHTHGQPATPTTVGKELGVFVYRLNRALIAVKSIKPSAKFNGATGTYAAINVAFPSYDWPKLSKKFIENDLGLEFNPVTTQIESHDYICYLFDAIRHFNNIVLNLDLDMWTYISMEYFKQIAIKSEVGSSTMPHKVNPIRFENSEANIELSNCVLMALSNKLSRSRMQRDLSDSSTLRNLGIAFGYSLQAIEQTLGGLEKVEVNKDKILLELNSKWEVLAEPIQTVLRKYGLPDAYNKLKELTRGKSISKEIIQEFINSLNQVSETDKQTLLSLTPDKYTGLASKIVEDNIK